MKSTFFIYLAACALLCSVATPADAAIVKGQNVPVSQSQFPWRLGQHFPNGDAAVDFVYEPTRGLFKPLGSGVILKHNFYSWCVDKYPRLPLNKNAIIASAKNITAPDSTCEIMFDNNKNGTLADDVLPSDAKAFIEHNGYGAGGKRISTAFPMMWFDDNWIARIAAQAYNRQSPYGLHIPLKTRWGVIQGDASKYEYYRADYARYMDQIALNGLAALSTSNIALANTYWADMKALTTPAYDNSNQRFNFFDKDHNSGATKKINDTYYLALLKLFADRMAHVAGINSITGNEAYQYARSLQSHIRNVQTVDAQGKYIGFVTNSTDPNSLINTESTLLNALALGSGANWSFEAGMQPMELNKTGSYFLRPHGVLSAVTSLSRVGHMTYGPYLKFPKGSYQVRFNTRTPNVTAANAKATLLTFDVYDSTKRKILASKVVTANQMRVNNQFTPIDLAFQHIDANSNLEFRIYWHGGLNADVGTIQVTKN